jgi:dUTP pyrophosphatase
MSKKKDSIEKEVSALWLGDFSQIIDDAIDLKKQVQVNGVDLTVREIMNFKGEGAIDFDNSKRVLPDYEKIELVNDEYWQLEAGSYVVKYNEIVSVPMNAVGILQPRSTLLRMGGTIVGAYWDSGYSGRGQGLLIAGRPIKIYKNARVAQLAFILSKDVEKGYEGKYQNESK